MRVFATVFLLLTITDAHAYLDPGTGSMVLQVILGGVAAVAVIAKLYWHKFLGLFGIGKKTESEDEAA